MSGKHGLIFEKQWLHILALTGLLAGVWSADILNLLDGGSLWGITARHWAWTAVVCAVVHQTLVMLVWRTELHLGLVSKLLGRGGFPIYGLLFAVLGIGRVVLVFFTAIASAQTIALPSLPSKVIAVLLALPALYLFYSVARYFGGKRALGMDHFDPEFAKKPFEKRGIFRFTSNGMYIYGFLILWVPVLWWGSTAALVAAAFNHAYIWVHYFATEKPDMKRIYSAKTRG